MKKYLIIFLLVILNISYGDHIHNGYVVNSYGDPVKTSYDDCLHTAYYNQNVHVEPQCINDQNKVNNQHNKN